MMQQPEEPVRFSISLTRADDSRLEKLAEQMRCSKSSLCSHWISVTLDKVEEMFDTPDADSKQELPSVEEYVAAFNAIQEKFTDGHRAMLSAHYHAPNHTTTATELARAAGYENYGGANLQYAKLGAMLAEYLGYDLPAHIDGSPFPTAFIVQWTQKEAWYCTLHPQVVKALGIVGLTKN